MKAEIVETPRGVLVNGQLVPRDQLPDVILAAVRVLELTRQSIETAAR